MSALSIKAGVADLYFIYIYFCEVKPAQAVVVRREGGRGSKRERERERDRETERQRERERETHTHTHTHTHTE